MSVQYQFTFIEWLDFQCELGIHTILPMKNFQLGFNNLTIRAGVLFWFFGFWFLYEKKMVYRFKK